MQIRLERNQQSYDNDLRSMLAAFYPGASIYAPGEKHAPEAGEDLVLSADFGQEKTVLSLTPTDPAPEPGRRPEVTVFGNPSDRQGFRNAFKLSLYRMLSAFTGRSLPWGDLTGVRPTKPALKLLSEGKEAWEAEAFYQTKYAVSPEKARLATLVAKTEQRLLRTIRLSDCYCVYIGIPFCPSRCLYCSFTSYPIAACADRVLPYLDCLERELEQIVRLQSGKRPIAVYIGGGTPSALSEAQTERLMELVDAALFPGTEGKNAKARTEYTVEAGRPDSITPEKLSCYLAHGVKRISINPQTMKNETLRTIGRAHTAEDFERAFGLARDAGFTNINVDLIAGLPDETAKTMEETLARIGALDPESLTVHSLALKRAADLKGQLESFRGRVHGDMEEMLSLAEAYAAEHGLNPYYLYRQKNIGGNLENVGYAKPGTECLYNVLIMEELTDIMAAGAGASTKLVRENPKRIVRVENMKNLEAYLERFDEVIERKEKDELWT